MRTTITLEDDVAAVVERLRQSEGRSLRDVINELLRLGMSKLSEAPSDVPTIRTRSVSLGGCRLSDVDDVAEVMAVAEGEMHR